MSAQTVLKKENKPSGSIGCAVIVALWGVGAGLLLWGSGVDLTVQLWLAGHYNAVFDAITRTLGELGLGRTLVWVGFVLGVLLIGRPLPAKGLRGIIRLYGWLLWTFVRGSFGQLGRWLRGKPGWTRAWQNLDETGRLCWLVVPVLAVTGVVQLVFKGLVGRPRPREVLWNHVNGFHVEPLWRTGRFDAHFLSFPSGHSCSTWAVAVVLMQAFPRYRRWIFSLAVAASAARFLALTPHFMGDVLAGAGVGAAIGMGLLQLTGGPVKTAALPVREVKKSRATSGANAMGAVKELL